MYLVLTEDISIDNSKSYKHDVATRAVKTAPISFLQLQIGNAILHK